MPLFLQVALGVVIGGVVLGALYMLVMAFASDEYRDMREPLLGCCSLAGLALLAAWWFFSR
jgi:hypothetical protein